MEPYKDIYKEVVSTFLYRYLSKSNIQKYERIYGEWKGLIFETFSRFYEESDKEETYALAVKKVQEDIQRYKEQKQEIEQAIQRLDKEYEEASLSQCFKIEETVKNALKEDEQVEKEIMECLEKIERIKRFPIRKPTIPKPQEKIIIREYYIDENGSECDDEREI